MSTEDQEREYCIRVCWLIMTVGKDIVRQKLDGFYPPGNGIGTLKEKLSRSSTVSKISNLKNLKVLNSLDYSRLYPSTGCIVSSKDFDISLLIKLLRNICSLSKPKNGWDTLPAPVDKTLSDDLTRIKYYRNTIAHNEEFRLSENDYDTIWKELSEAFIRLGGTSINVHIDNLLTDPLTESAYDARKELHEWYLKDLDWKFKFNIQLKKLEDMCKRMEEKQDNKDFIREVRDLHTLMVKENAKNASVMSTEHEDILMQHMQAKDEIGERLHKVETSMKESSIFSKYIVPGLQFATLAVFTGAAAFAYREYIQSSPVEDVYKLEITNEYKPSTSRGETSSIKTCSRNKTSFRESEIKGDVEGKYKYKQQTVEDVNEPKVTKESKPSTSKRETSNSKTCSRNKTSFKKTEIKGDDNGKYKNKQRTCKTGEDVTEPEITNESKPNASRGETSNSKTCSRNKTSFKETEKKGNGERKFKDKQQTENIPKPDNYIYPYQCDDCGEHFPVSKGI
ncbi:unnamed protein product [Mytilus coruscus]|uniref:DZIP3-like HEPN domain-containing protein n=1 Tax=Mytilus coruscus TaxID=42192 RepID=A0A6J8E5R6_MYTCO|nr:unnamed protein product [Mytilus coruscus]